MELTTRLQIIVGLLILSLAPLSAGDGEDAFRPVATGWSAVNGRLWVQPYREDALWLNGLRQCTWGDNPGTICMKPGDVLISGSPIRWVSDYPQPTTLPLGFYRYRLDRLTSRTAYFTRTIFEALGEDLGSQRTRYHMGALLSTEHVEADVSHSHSVLPDEWGGAFLVSGTARSARTK